MNERRPPALEPAGRPRPPATAEDGAEDGSDLGAIRIHHGVIAAISRTAALNVPGVVEMSGSLADGLASMIGKATFDRGIKVETEGHGVSVELHLVLEYGVRIPQVAWRVQNEVRRAIEEMTGKNVKTVDVVVQNVKVSAPPPEREANA